MRGRYAPLKTSEKRSGSLALAPRGLV